MDRMHKRNRWLSEFRDLDSALGWLEFWGIKRRYRVGLRHAWEARERARDRGVEVDYHLIVRGRVQNPYLEMSKKMASPNGKDLNGEV